ncbi:unnamed protein product [Lymnaea stagnalis]|uniref:Protein kinase domain-containing protein n=1 Tax=Lymnaea stagnalis TaxID=6523 RepID=A0AAV2H9B4_LYMST
MRNKPKSCTKPTDNLRLSRMGDEYLIKELVDRKFTKELVQQVNNGALDYLLPFLHINTETQTIEIQLPYAKIICLLDLVSQKPNCKIQSLIHKLALMVDRIHKSGFVLGDIRASLIFVNSESEDEMKFHPVSLAFINYVVDKRRPVEFSKPKDPVTLARAAPEVIEYGHYSFASDVYNFAVLIHELYDTPIKADAMHYVNDRLAKLIEGEIKIKELKKPTAMSGKLFQLTRRCLDPDPSERPQVVDLLNFFSIDTAVSRRSQFMDDSSSDVYPRDNETGNSEEENPRPQRSRPNGRPRTPTQQDNNLTNNLSFNLINPSQTDSDCETDLYNQNASCQRTRLFRKKGFYLKSKETSIANRNSYPSRPRSTALKNRISVGTEGHANVTESGDSGAEGCEGGAEGCTFVPAYEDMTDSDKYDDILGNPTPTVRNVLFRTSESVSGIGVDPRVARQGHYDSDSSLDVGHSDYSEINEENQTIPEEEQDVYEMY